MVKDMRSEEYYYKSADIDNLSDLEKKKYEYFNEYGFNLDSNKRKNYDLERYAEKLKNTVKQADINVKR